MAEGVGSVPEMREVWVELDRLRTFFSGPASAPDAIAQELRPVIEFERVLWRQERHITFVGAFTAGKSSLLNALMGAPLLPVRANRATGVITSIRYGSPTSATLIASGTGDARTIPLTDLASFILLDLSGNDVLPPSGVEEVHITAPLPLLPARAVLVDTPGLLAGEALTERSYGELEHSDLAVMVLSADKVLSARERDTARHIDRLLHGNIVYALNRLDLVEEDDRAEVLDWVEAALRDSGNAIVGQPAIFATAAGGGEGAADEGVLELREWLTWLLSAPEGDRTVILSRLGVLEARLNRLDSFVRAELAAAHRATEQARIAAAAALSRERADIRGRIAQDRVRLQACREALPEAGELFVTACVAESLTEIASGHAPTTLRIRYEPALERYSGHVNEAVREAVIDAPVTVPELDFAQWVLHAEVSAVTDPASDVGAMFGTLMDRVVAGGSTGRDTGASIGSWFSKKVLGIDAEGETRRRIESVARGVVPSLQQEAERYIAKADGLLEEADRFYAEWTRSSPQVAAAEEAERAYERVLEWRKEFLRQVRAIVPLVTDPA